MATLTCKADEIGNPSPGDTVEMTVDSVENGMASLSYKEMESEGEDNMKPEPSAMKDMAAAFSQSEE